MTVTVTVICTGDFRISVCQIVSGWFLPGVIKSAAAVAPHL